jgi:hypothetical protein
MTSFKIIFTNKKSKNKIELNKRNRKSNVRPIWLMLNLLIMPGYDLIENQKRSTASKPTRNDHARAAPLRPKLIIRDHNRII